MKTSQIKTLKNKYRYKSTHVHICEFPKTGNHNVQKTCKVIKKDNTSKVDIEYNLCWFLTAGYGAFP